MCVSLIIETLCSRYFDFPNCIDEEIETLKDCHLLKVIEVLIKQGFKDTSSTYQYICSYFKYFSLSSTKSSSTNLMGNSSNRAQQMLFALFLVHLEIT